MKETRLYSIFAWKRARDFFSSQDRGRIRKFTSEALIINFELIKSKRESKRESHLVRYNLIGIVFSKVIAIVQATD